MSKRKQQGDDLHWRKAGWSGRYRELVDGVMVRRCVPLGTKDKQVARAKLQQLINGGKLPEKAEEKETFEEAARRIVATQTKVKTVGERLRRLEKYAFPHFGKRPVDTIQSADILDALRKAAEKDLSQALIKHLHADLSSVFDALVRYDPTEKQKNPVEKVKVSEEVNGKEDPRKRVILTDGEFVKFINWPGLDPELRLMCLVARCLGGMRTSDLSAWDWRHVDLVNWATTTVYRPKTKATATLHIPPELVDELKLWWEAAGKPSKGFIFPERNGKRAGQQRVKRSHARRLRIALWAAGVRRGPTKKECALQTDMPGEYGSRRVDFHSFRRSYCTVLALSGVNEQQAMAMAGHADSSTHRGYIQIATALKQPAGIVPAGIQVPARNDVNTPEKQPWTPTVSNDQLKEEVTAMQLLGMFENQRSQVISSEGRQASTNQTNLFSFHIAEGVYQTSCDGVVATDSVQSADSVFDLTFETQGVWL